jgi:hypothetical protein
MAEGVEDEVALLEQARTRLVALLEPDENWRALVRAGGRAEDAVARRARDARLEMALATNVVYRAWRHVGEAIAALKGEALAAPPIAVPTSEPGPSKSELPEDIAELIRSRAAEEARLAMQKPQEGARPRQSKPPVMAPAASDAAVHLPPPQTSAGEEATVTFVTREPIAGPSPVEGAARRRPLLRDRLRNLTAESNTQPPAFSLPQVPSEEADVTILTDDAIRERRLAEERASAIGRFRKALLGD